MKLLVFQVYKDTTHDQTTYNFRSPISVPTTTCLDKKELAQKYCDISKLPFNLLNVEYDDPVND